MKNQLDIVLLFKFERLINSIHYKLYSNTNNELVTCILMGLIITLSLVSRTIIIGYTINLISNILSRVVTSIFGNWLGKLLVNIATFPGVIVHELSHLVVAVITFAKIKKVKLFKLNIFDKSSTLGQVEFNPRGTKWMQSLQKTLSASAPVYIGTIIIYLIYNNINFDSLISVLINSYLIVSIALHCRLSKQDIKVIKEGLLRTILVIFVISSIILNCHY